MVLMVDRRPPRAAAMGLVRATTRLVGTTMRGVARSLPNSLPNVSTRMLPLRWMCTLCVPFGYASWPSPMVCVILACTPASSHPGKRPPPNSASASSSMSTKDEGTDDDEAVEAPEDNVWSELPPSPPVTSLMLSSKYKGAAAAAAAAAAGDCARGGLAVPYMVPLESMLPTATTRCDGFKCCCCVWEVVE